MPAPAELGRRSRHQAVTAALAAMAVAGFNLFYRLGEPAQPIWDENYYLTTTARYELGYASFASHPPLGLMLIAAGDHMSGLNAGIDWAPIAAVKHITGDQMPTGFSYFGVRWMSALFGVLATGAVSLLMSELVGGATAALVATSPFLFDTALIAQFRAAQLDAFQMCFAAVALMCLIRSSRGAGWLLGFGFACGLCTMVRANGILLLAGTILPLLRDARLALSRLEGVKRMLRHAAAIGIGLTAAVALVFCAHVMTTARAMPANWAAARADAPYVSTAYRSFLEGSAPLSAGVIIAAADGYRRFAAADVAGVGLSDANASTPWLWPIGQTPIVYRWDSDGSTTSYIALIPNRAAWLISLAGLIIGVAVIACGSIASALEPDEYCLVVVLVSLWCLFMVSNLFLYSIRAMYLYHYFVPLLLGWLMAAMLFEILVPPSHQHWIVIFIIASVLGCFLLTAPLALHHPITKESCRWRTIVNGRNLCRISDRSLRGYLSGA